MNIMLLCKVVDNYGDIGFVYRLSRALKQLKEEIHLTLVVSNLESFAFMAEGIFKDKGFQVYDGNDVLDWNNNEACIEYCKKKLPSYIIECFQCGRPDWLEELLFNNEKTKATIINLEYLTAEDWADDFHLLKSGTRKQDIKKYNFMPGFTNKTGGLLLEEPFFSLAKSENNSTLPQSVIVFSYQQDFTLLTKILEQCSKKISINVQVAKALSEKPFFESYTQNNCSFKTEKLPRLNQTQWDELLCKSSINFIRGEDSFSRACLAGKPFLWHIYPQDEEFHIVKLHALLLRMKPFFSNEDFTVYSKLSLLYNIRDAKMLGEEAYEIIEKCLTKEDLEGKNTERLMLHFVENSLKKNSEFNKGFRNFAKSLFENGNLAQHLVSFLHSLEEKA